MWDSSAMSSENKLGCDLCRVLENVKVHVRGCTNPTLGKKELMGACGLNQPSPATPAIDVQAWGEGAKRADTAQLGVEQIAVSFSGKEGWLKLGSGVGHRLSLPEGR